MKKLILLLIVLLYSNYSLSNSNFFYYSGNKLYQEINSDKGTYANAYVTGYIIGVIDRIQDDSKSGLCLENVLIGQITDVVKKYLTEHPELRQYPAEQIVAESIYKAFRCKK